MSGKKCPVCGTEYIKYRRTTEAIDKVSEIYFCQNCQKEVSIDTKRSSSGSKWMMTFFGIMNLTNRNEMQVYHNEDGTVTVIQKCVDTSYRMVNSTIHRVPKVYVDGGSRDFHIRCDTFRSPNDATGNYLTVEYIEMNSELTKKALQNEAMRIIHKEKNRFDVPWESPENLLDDICAWIRPQIGSPEISKVVANAHKSGCYVATAVYGSYDCPPVWTLRRYRDYTLAGTWYGRAFIKAYYAISPTLVKWFGNTKWFRKMWKGKLDRLVSKLQAQGFEDTPYEDRDW